MIRLVLSNILNTFANLVLHVQANSIRLPYVRLPKPHDSSWLSSRFKLVFEKHWIHSLLGANLVMAMAMVPGLGAKNIDVNLEDQVELAPTVLISSPDLMSSAVTTQETYAYPVERLRYVGQYYKADHKGYDLNSYVGDDVYSYTSGQVAQVKYAQTGYGHHVLVDHGSNLFTVYAHLGEIFVKPGQRVEAGQVLGEIGMTGYTTGPHLHFEVRDNFVAVNPGSYLDI